MNARSASAYYNLGAVYLAWEDLQAARRALASASALAPEDEMRAFQLGQVEARLGREAAARTAWRRAAAAPYFVSRATALMQERNYEAALQAAERAAAIDTTLSKAQMLRGRALSAIERYAEAVTAFEVAAELAPDDPEPFYQAAVLLGRRLKRPDAAILAITQSLDVDPTYPPALLEWARYDLYAGECARAAEKLAPLLRPDAPEAYVEQVAVQLGSCYLEQGDPVLALPVLVQAVTVENESVRATWLLARAYDATGAREAALATCRRVLVLKPDHAEAQALLNRLTAH